MPLLLEYVRPIAATGQDLHILPLYAQANLDPLQALCIQGGRDEHESNSLVGCAQTPPEYRRIWPEVPTSVGICHLSQFSFVLEECQTEPYLRLVNSNVADFEFADPSLDVRGSQRFHIAEENIQHGAW